RFVRALNQAKKADSDWESYRTLLLNSEGGDVATAMAIGRRVRQAQIVTGVHERSICASACILILAGGVSRYARDEAINVIFVQPQFSTKSADLVAKEINGQVIPADPLALDWLDNMKKVAEQFKEVLK
ncbi:MAG TPA: hypothetical protein PLF65_05925, partial [Desulfobacter postgatei]|nr:hypothetical protein [Desulfobacter postgatei]